MSFLPDGYKQPPSNSRYLRPVIGNNPFRILSDAITGWIDWDNKQPIRTRQQPKQSIDPTKPAKHFWAFVVWDLKDKNIKILEITQRTIQDAILGFHQDENWGDPKLYDLNIKREGNDMQTTKYNVVPTPPKPLSIDILKEYDEQQINLNALFSGGDPFNSELQMPSANDTEQEQCGHIDDYQTRTEGFPPIDVDNLPM